MKIEILDEQIDIVMVEELKQQLEVLEKQYKSKKNYNMWYWNDKKKDRKKLKKHIKAMKLLLEYYD